MTDLSTLRIGVDSRDVRGATSDLRSLGGAASDAEQKTSGLSKAFGGLRGILASIGLGFVAKDIIAMADTMSLLSGRLALVTKDAQQLAAVESRLFEMAQRTRVGYESTVELYARMARSTQSMGASQASVLQVTETINKALIVSGASAQQASGALMQLGQAFASGALRGDELNSVMEGMPRVAQAIAEGMGITVGELRKLGAQGKLTGAQVFNALQKSAQSVATEFDKMPTTVGQSMTVLSSSIMKFVGDINESTGFTERLASIIVALSRNFDTLAAAAMSAALAFAAVKASMAASAITSYISSVIALERALGATSVATALFSAVTKMAQGAFRALTATMLANPIIAAAAAIAAVGFALYEFRDANVAVGGETIRFGDIFLGVWGVIKNALVFVQTIFTQGWEQAFGSISPALQEVGQFFDRAFSYIGNTIRDYVNRYIGFFVGLGAAIKAVFGDEDVVGAFMSGLNADYVGAFSDAVGNGVVALARFGAASRAAETAQSDLGQAAALTGQAIDDGGKKTEDAIKKYKDYISALNMETAQIGLTPENSKALQIEAEALEAEAAGFRNLAAEIRAAGAAYAEKAAAQKLVDLGREAADLEFQNSLYGQQAVEVAVLTAAHDLMAQGISAASAEYNRLIEAVREGALQEEADKVKQAWESLASDINFDAVFGDTGKAFAGILNGIDQMIERQQAYNEVIAFGKLTETEAAAARKRNVALQINSYANIAGSMKGFFKEGSKGYKALQAAETTFRAVELAMAIKAAAVKLGLIGTVTTAKVASDATMAASDTSRSLVEMANSAKTTVVKGIEAVVNAIRSMPFPLNLIAGAATAAAVASLGVAISGAFKGGEKQAPSNNGTGTVFGDSTKQSESIQNSLEILSQVDTLTMRYSAQMAASLRNIENNIGGLTNLVLRTNGIEASAAGVKTGTETTGILGNMLSLQNTVGDVVGKLPIIGGTLKGLIGFASGIVNSLFGTKTKIVGQGIYGSQQSLTDIMAGGFEGQYFTDIKKTKKFLGVSTGSSYSTRYRPADEELNRQFSLIFSNFYDAISAASVPLGLSLNEVESRLNGFVVNIGKIDLKGLTGEQIQEKLTAVFGAAADNMAKAAIPGLDEFQKVGEGYFETIVRVASGVEQAGVLLQRIGVQAIEYTDILNKQGDVAAEIIRQSVVLNDASAGVAGGFAEIIKNANGSAEELIDIVLQLRQLQEMLVSTGKAAIDLTTYMIAGAGGVEELSGGLQSFFDNVLTDADRISSMLTKMISAFNALGQNMPTTLAGFADLVASIDTTTAAGQELYGAVIALTPSFVDMMDAITKARETALQAEQDAISDLQDAVKGLNDDVAKAESALSAAIKRQQDAANAAAKTALKAQIDAMKEQAKTLGDAVRQFETLGAALRAFSADIVPLSGTGTGSIEALRRQFNELAARAQLGDTQAMADLPEVGKNLRDATIATATDRTSMMLALYAIKEQTDAAIGTADRQRDIAQEQLDALNAQIEATQAQIDAIGATTDAVLTVAEAQAALDAAMAARDATMRDITAAGFASLIAVGELTNAQLAALAIAAIQQARTDQAAVDQAMAQARAEAQQAAADSAAAAAAAAAQAASDAAAAAAAVATAIPASYAEWLAQNGYNLSGITFPGFANGGDFGGGWRIVGENGPELEATGPSRIYDSNKTSDMLNGNATAEEVKRLREELRSAMFAIAKNTGKTAQQLDRWDGDGMPEVRTVA